MEYCPIVGNITEIPPIAEMKMMHLHRPRQLEAPLNVTVNILSYHALSVG